MELDALRTTTSAAITLAYMTPCGSLTLWRSRRVALRRLRRVTIPTWSSASTRSNRGLMATQQVHIRHDCVGSADLHLGPCCVSLAAEHRIESQSVIDCERSVAQCDAEEVFKPALQSGILCLSYPSAS
jgi:hypothetical protein